MKVTFCDLELLNRPFLPALRRAFDDVIGSGQYILAGEVEAFEREWSAYCRKGHAIGVGNCFDGIVLMLQAYGIGPGDEVIVPSNTYVATWMAVSATGARPVPVEPDSTTHCIDPNRIKAAVRYRTKAILAVHLYGRPANIQALREALREASGRDLPILVDAAQAHGIKGDALGDCAAFSFYPTKNLGGLGDGGAVVTDFDLIAERIRALRNYGSVEKNVNAMIGRNSRLDEMQAAFLMAKLPYLDGMNAKRKAIAATYGMKSPGVFHQCVMVHPERDAFRRELQEAGIETMIHYPTPPHLQPAYSGRFRPGDFPIAERLARTVISLPVSPELTEEKVKYVAERIQVTA